MSTSGHERKRVLLTVNHNRLSGIERFTILLASHVDASRFDVTVAIPCEGPLSELLKAKGIRRVVYHNPPEKRATPRALFSIFMLLRQGRYHIVHAQAGSAPCWLAKLTGVALVIEHRHGLDFTPEKAAQMNPLRLMYERLKQYAVDYTLTVCEADRRTLVNRFRYRSEKVITVYYGIEPLFGPPSSPPRQRFTVGTMGRLTYQKGQEFFIEAARLVKRRGFDFEYPIYGGGELHGRFAAMIRRHDLERDVRLMGYVNDTDAALATMDLFVLTSRYEGIPFVILEAMRSGLAIISTKAGGIAELIEHRRNGMLVERDDAAAVAENIILLHQDAALRTALGRQAKRDFEAKCLVGDMAAAIERIYDAPFNRARS